MNIGCVLMGATVLPTNQGKGTAAALGEDSGRVV